MNTLIKETEYIVLGRPTLTEFRDAIAEHNVTNAFMAVGNGVALMWLGIDMHDLERTLRTMVHAYNDMPIDVGATFAVQHDRNAKYATLFLRTIPHQ